MKKIIIGSTLALSLLFSCKSILPANIILESEVLRLADGLAFGVNADVLEDIGRFIREICDLTMGKKDEKGVKLRWVEKKLETGIIRRAVAFEYGDKLYTVRELAQIEKTIHASSLNSTQKQEKLQKLCECLEDIKKEIIKQEIKFIILTKPEELEIIRTKFKQNNLILESVGFDFIAQTTVSLNEEQKNKLKLLIKNLNKHEDVQEIYSNFIEL